MSMQASILPPLPAKVFGHALTFIRLVVTLNLACRAQPTYQPPTALSASRLSRLEALADQQAQATEASARQLSKLQTRTRILGQDSKPPLRKVCPYSLGTVHGFLSE